MLSRTRKVYDVTIIGAGVLGTSCALDLSRRGYKVGVIDKNSEAGSGTTSYSSGICRMFYSQIDSVKLSYEGYHIFRDWERFIGDIDKRGMASLNNCGGLILKTENSKKFLESTIPLMKSVGVPLKEWSEQETQNNLKELGMNLNDSFIPCKVDDNNFGIPVEGRKVEGAIYMPNTGYVSDPQLVCKNMEFASKKVGCEYHYNSEIVNILKDENKIEGVKLKNGEVISSRIVLNAAGAHSNKITEMAFKNCKNDMKLTTKPLRHEVCVVPSPKGVNFSENGMFIVDMDTGVHFRPETGNRILIGSNDPECDEQKIIEDIDNYSLDLSEQWDTQVYRGALRFPNLPIAQGKNKQGVVSFYDITEDWTPIYDKSSLKGYFMAIGTSGNQFKNAGVIGKVIGDIIYMNDMGVNTDVENISSYMPNIKEIINLKSFSRLRELLDTNKSVWS